MQKLSVIIKNASSNKPLICILFFVAYTFGLFTFYSSETKLIATLVSSLFLFFLLFLAFNKTLNKVLSSYFVLALYLLFVCGFLNAKIHSVSADDFSNIEYLKNVYLKGVVQNAPKCASHSLNCKFPIEVKSAFIEGKNYDINNSKVLVVVKKSDKFDVNELKLGDAINLYGVLSTPSCATNPSQFDYRKFLSNKGILKTFYVNDNSISIVGHSSLKDVKFEKTSARKIRFLFLYALKELNDLRDSVINKHSKYIKSPKLEVLGGIVFGDEAVNPPDEVKDSFISSGLLHLLAASGLNVALILSMWLALIYFFNIPYRLKIISGIFIVFIYTLMTGFPPSIVRASVMLMLILIGKLLYREANGISLIFTAGLLILIFKPEFVTDVGFQLSFLVTLGLIVCTPCINNLVLPYEKNYLKKIKNFPKIIKSLLLSVSPLSLVCCIFVPLIAQFWAGPLQAYYFNTFSTYSIFANISVMPFIGIISFLGFISTAFCFVPFLSDILLPLFDFILNFTIELLLNISSFFASLPHSIIKTASPSVFWIILFYIFVITFFFALKNLFKKKKLNIYLVAQFLILSLFLLSVPSENVEIIFFNVGNADNCLIKTPKNKYIMIDTGRYIYEGLTTAKAITLEYLYDKNIKNIDTLVVTHYDSDHAGGLVDILKSVKVDKLIIPKLECTSKNSCEIKKYVEENNIKYIVPKNNQKFYFDSNVTLTNYLPHTDFLKSRNDFSTVSLLEINETKILFMADAGVKAYESIESFIPKNIDILKTAHHGAKYTVNDEMLKKLNPKYSVILTGKNPYGHPNYHTVLLLNKYSTVLSTKEYGALKFVVNKQIIPYAFDSKKRKFQELSLQRSL